MLNVPPAVELLGAEMDRCVAGAGVVEVEPTNPPTTKFAFGLPRPVTKS